MSLTEAEFQTILANQRNANAPLHQMRTIAQARPRRGRMNKWERLYAATLEGRKAAGEVIWHEFEAVKLRLADGAWYTPDFMVLTPGGLEFHEVKGFWREAARVRIKVASDKYPFPVYAITRARNGEWQYERIGGRA